jgi:DNA replication and repair protein RecF
VLLEHLWLRDVRNYEEAELALAAGLTAVLGANGQGKSNLLEAVAYLAELGSFRGAPTDALIRMGADSAVIRAEGVREGRRLLIEAELNRTGRNRVQVNRQPLRKARDLLGTLRVTVFSPDDLELVKGGPALRRELLDRALVASRVRNDQLRSDVDKVLRQRNALLKQAGGRLTDDIATTLDVWDAKLSEVGEALVAERRRLLDAMAPIVADRYRTLASSDVEVIVEYRSGWVDRGLAEALAEARRDDIRRGVSTVGPHRDEVALSIEGMPARTHASQGEQRTLALALRLATHTVVTTEAGSAPLLLLDDVFSELDPVRSRALVDHLPDAQTLLTTAGPLPEGATPAAVVRIEGGRIVPV